MIKEQKEIDSHFSDALMTVCDSSFIVYGVNNKMYEAVEILLKDCCNDIYDYIDWWLHEDVDHVVRDDYHEWYLDSVEQLYDYIVEMQPEWVAARAQGNNA